MVIEAVDNFVSRVVPSGYLPSAVPGIGLVVAGLASLALSAFSLTLPRAKQTAAPAESGSAWATAFGLLQKPFILVLWLVTLVDAFVHNLYFNWTGVFLGTAREAGLTVAAEAADSDIPGLMAAVLALAARTRATKQADGSWVGKADPVKKGWTAAFIELEYATGSLVPFRQSTAVRITPDTLPHAGRQSTAVRITPDTLPHAGFDPKTLPYEGDLPKAKP